MTAVPGGVGTLLIGRSATSVLVPQLDVKKVV